MIPTICTDPSQLEFVRTLMLTGLILLVILLAANNYAPKPKPTKSTTYCPLHRTDRDQCNDKHED